jgi:hypothetical protein
MRRYPECGPIQRGQEMSSWVGLGCVSVFCIFPHLIPHLIAGSKGETWHLCTGSIPLARPCAADSSSD